MEALYRLFLDIATRKFERTMRQARGTKVRKTRYNYPHQGAQEKARRVRQLERGIISNYPGR